jgi:hypothetical protein
MGNILLYCLVDEIDYLNNLFNRYGLDRVEINNLILISIKD